MSKLVNRPCLVWRVCDGHPPYLVCSHCLNVRKNSNKTSHCFSVHETLLYWKYNNKIRRRHTTPTDELTNITHVHTISKFLSFDCNLVNTLNLFWGFSLATIFYYSSLIIISQILVLTFPSVYIFCMFFWISWEHVVRKSSRI